MKKYILLVLLASYVSSYAQHYNIDFGTDTGTITCAKPFGAQPVYCSRDTIVTHPNSYSMNFISSNWYKSGPIGFPEKCQFVLANPGDTDIGTGSELQFWQDDYPDLRFQVSDFSDSLFTVSFEIKINKPSPLHWSYPSIFFYFGDKNSKYLNKSMTYSYNQYPTDTMIFGQVRFRSDGLLPNYYNSLEALYAPTPYGVGEYPRVVSTLIDQGIKHTITVYANTTNNSHAYTKNGVTKSLPAHNYHVYYDTSQLYSDIPDLYYRGGPISAFSFYVKDPNYYAPIIVDDVQWGDWSGSQVLPITLMSFSGFVCEREACLKWETVSEINNRMFVVERSTDGESFESIGEVDGNGTASQPHEYAYRDMRIDKSVYYYRLKQIDYDGAYSYSPIVSVDVPESAVACDLRNLSAWTDYTYKLYDMSGRSYAGAAASFDPKAFHGLYLMLVYRNGELVCSQKKIFQ